MQNKLETLRKSDGTFNNVFSKKQFSEREIAIYVNLEQKFWLQFKMKAKYEFLNMKVFLKSLNDCYSNLQNVPF
jgi:hypothetical protein